VVLAPADELALLLAEDAGVCCEPEPPPPLAPGTFRLTFVDVVELDEPLDVLLADEDEDEAAARLAKQPLTSTDSASPYL
jgi:hypothetical protein